MRERWEVKEKQGRHRGRKIVGRQEDRARRRQAERERERNKLRGGNASERNREKEGPRE